jgi:methylenetetrahydrofolate reductase (NADPH)
MVGLSTPPPDSAARFEVLPLGKSQQEAAALPEPVRLTVTCSPKLGPDRSVQVARRLHELGHAVTVHVAARMVRDRSHLDELLATMATAGIDDMFVIGGDADPPLGGYESAVELLPIIAAHERRPRTIGIAGYPEGHPNIDDATLDRALAEKSRLADYVTTQLCFDPEALRGWIVGQRQHGLTLPVLIGMPGKVTGARLLEMSARIGVGPSVAFLRKQRGLRKLFGLFRRAESDRVYGAMAPWVGDPELGVAGLHFFTFNQLIATYEWQHQKQELRAVSSRAESDAVARGYVHPEERTT